MPVGAAPGRSRADEHPVRREEGRRPADGLRSGGQPAGEPHGAVRFQGDRRALAKAAAKVMVGVTLAEQGITREPIPAHVSVKEAVFPFVKFTGVDIVLGPEMKSTGEVMGVSDRFSIAFAKSQLAAGTFLPTQRQRLHQRGPAAEGPNRRRLHGGWRSSASRSSPPAARRSGSRRPAFACSG